MTATYYVPTEKEGPSDIYLERRKTIFAMANTLAGRMGSLMHSEDPFEIDGCRVIPRIPCDVKAPLLEMEGDRGAQERFKKRLEELTGIRLRRTKAEGEKQWRGI